MASSLREPTPAIRTYANALTDRWPEDIEHLGVGERAAFVMAEMAEEHGLVAFDLYLEIMRPAPVEITDEIYRDWWAKVFEILPTDDHRR